MKKLLYAASGAGHLKHFHRPYLAALAERGWEVWTFCPGGAVLPGVHHSVDLPLKKRLWSPVNFRTALQLSRILKREKFDLICVHTSLAAFFVRLALRIAGKENSRVVNTVHGYLFDDRTSLPRRLLLLGAEKLTAAVTDTVLTMNACDREIALRHRLGDEVLPVDGIGVEFGNFARCERESARIALGLAAERFVLLYPAEFSARKNQAFLIRSLAQLPEEVTLVLPGRGSELENCRKLAVRCGVAERVLLPGYVDDMSLWYAAADVCVSASRIEGLPFHVMEAMYFERPVVASCIKGHTDLITDGAEGFLYGYNDDFAFCDCITLLMKDAELRSIMGEKGRKKVEKYALEQVMPQVLRGMLGSEEETSGTTGSRSNLTFR